MASPTVAAPGTGDGAVGDVSAARCGVAAGRDASNNAVTCKFGLTPEQLKQLTEAAVKGATDALQDHVDKVSRTLGVTEDAAEKLLKIVGEDPNIPEGKLAEALSKIAADYQRLQTQVAALNPDNPTAKVLVDEAKPEIDAGRFHRAHELLQEATQAQIAAAQEARKLREHAQGAEEAQMLGAANSSAAEGDVAMTERRYEEAAQLFEQAAGYVPAGHANERGGYLLRQEDALFREGDERGDNAALENAAAICRRALEQYPRAEAASDWAMTQIYLGNALAMLGERESGTEHLNQAIAAYRAALEERPRKRVPLDWAAAQMGLGNALATLGERESGTARLDEAVQAYRAALEEWTRERVPLLWAGAESNLGNALKDLGERESGTAKLEEAVAAYRASLEEGTRERVPLAWARTQNDLGNALARLGERESGTEKLEQAVAAYRAALEEETRERVPLLWASAESNLGNALQELGERESGTEKLEEAIATYSAALEEQTRERVPLVWAEDSGNQGVAMMLVAERTNDGAMAETAVGRIEAAYETSRSGGHAQWAAYYQAQLPKAQAILDRLKGK